MVSRWIPYTKGNKKCELNCMPRGERFYYRHKDQVVDGTRCDENKLDVCVNGQCLVMSYTLLHYNTMDTNIYLKKFNLKIRVTKEKTRLNVVESFSKTEKMSQWLLLKKIDFTVRPYVKLKRNVMYFNNCVLIYVECRGGIRGGAKGKFIKHYKNVNKNHTMKIICIRHH